MPLEQKQGKNASCPHEACEGDDIKQINQQKATWLQIPRKSKKENYRRMLKKKINDAVQPDSEEVPGETPQGDTCMWVENCRMSELGKMWRKGSKQWEQNVERF